MLTTHPQSTPHKNNNKNTPPHPQDYENTVFFQQIGNHIQNAPLFGVSFTTWAPLVLFPYVALLLTGAFNTLATTLAPRGAPVAFDLDYAMGTEHDTGVRLLHLEAEAYQRGQPVGAATLPLLRDGGPGVVEGVAVAVEGWGGVEGGGGWVGWLWGGKRGRRAQGQGLNRLGRVLHFVYMRGTHVHARTCTLYITHTGPCSYNKACTPPPTTTTPPVASHVGGRPLWGPSQGPSLAASPHCLGEAVKGDRGLGMAVGGTGPHRGWHRAWVPCTWRVTMTKRAPLDGGGGGDGGAGADGDADNL